MNARILAGFLALLTLPVAAALPHVPAPAPHLAADAPMTPATLRAPQDTFLPNLTAPDLDRSIRWSLLAMHERGQHVPRGTADALASPDEDAQDAERYRFARSIGDLDGDGVADLIIQQYDGITLESRVIAASGADNRVLWHVENGLEVQRYLWPRFGDSLAGASDNGIPAGDLSGDGVADVLVLRLEVFRTLPPPGFERLGFGQITVRGGLGAHDGRDGALLWEEPILGTITWADYDPSVLLYLNWPTGWLHYEGPSGPRVAMKTTTIVHYLAMDPVCWLTGSCIFWAGDTVTTDRIQAFDARTKQVVMTRDIPPTYDARHTMFTWFTGVADLGRGDELDLVLDQWLMARPIIPEYYNPITQERIVKYGRGMRMLALDGNDGTDLWSTVIFDESQVRVNALPEEPFEELVWTGGQILGDLTGDGVDDPLALYLTVDVSNPGTVNGLFRTHFIPVDGRTGVRVWNDIKYQGWGYGASLATPQHNPRLLAIGTVDYLTGALPGGAFPHKDVHLAVLSLDSKEALWDFSHRWAEDNGLSYQLTLYQYFHSLAPHDWDGDGIRDLVTPAQHVKPQGANQTLLSTSKHTYQILGGIDGRELYKFTAWGPMGVVANCAFDDGSLALVVGHSRRADLLKVDMLANEQERRQPFYFDERPRPATAPVNLLNLAVHCDTSHDREVYSINLQTFAYGNGGPGNPYLLETHSVVGLFGAPGDLLWMDPVLGVEVPLVPSLELPIRIQSMPWWQSSNLLLVPAGILPGAALGVALRVVQVRRNGRNGGDLP
jgi:hypothetical protein